MNLKILQDDPLGVLFSTKPVVEQAQFVSINGERLDGLADQVVKKFSNGLDGQELGVSSTGNLEYDAQLVFIEDAVNFCFWPDKEKPRWKVISGGWRGLVTCFKRALAENVPILDAKYLSELTPEDARKIFRGENGIEIPLLQERINNLREAGRVLQEKFDGKFSNLLEASDYDSIKIVNALLDNFPSFQDISILNGQEVKLLKRAQICPNDLAYAFKGTANKITNLDKLTAYADYKLPQVLRMFGVLSYEKSLAEKIDDLINLPHDSAEEVEIRAATIWAVELLRQKIGKLTAGEIDNTIWLMSQDIQSKSKPYHRTRTIFY